MFVARGSRVVVGLFVLAAGVGRVGIARGQDASPPPLRAPVVNGDDKEPGVVSPADEPLPLPAPAARPRRQRAPKAPPPTAPEEPVDDRVDPRSVWVPGYWSWSTDRDDFAWVAGSWRVAPEGATWVAGRWMRDAEGWYREPGYWNTPRARAGAGEAVAPRNWRVAGPPANQPDDPPGAAPGPNAFYVPGHYTPQGDRLTWTRGFWAEVQPGWDWVPSRWIRRANGWEYREGYWLRDRADDQVRRRTAARPVPDDRPGLPPAIVESAPTDRDAGVPPGATPPRDPIAEAEAEATAPFPPRTAYPLPRSVYPFGYGPPPVVIRPPGMYPYGPGGVVVPATVPPFVRRILDRVLP